MENWTDYTDTLTADDADALAAVAEAGIPDEDEGDTLPVYGCAENDGSDEILCDNAAYADGDACPEHGGPTAEQRRAYLQDGVEYR